MDNYKNFQNMEEYEEPVCSNFDHNINYDVADQLRLNPNLYADYPCWNCHCKVWYDQEKQKFGCQIWCYGCISNEIYEDTVEEIKNEVCERYGND